MVFISRLLLRIRAVILQRQNLQGLNTLRLMALIPQEPNQLPERLMARSTHLAGAPAFHPLGYPTLLPVYLKSK